MNLNSIVSAFTSMSLKEVKLARHFCVVCAKKRYFFMLKESDIYVRCAGCLSSTASLSIVSVLTEFNLIEKSSSVYELSSRGTLFRFLQRKSSNFTFSEFFSDVELGTEKNGVLCQDVQNLTFPEQSFDLCTSTDVFEHVPDDTRGFENIYRVLKDNGKLVFTVPIDVNANTIQRAILHDNGEIEHLEPPEYHGDPISRTGKILAYRNYGADIVEKLKLIGFRQASIEYPRDITPWAYVRPVILACK